MFDIIGLGQFHVEITGGLFDDDGKSNMFAELRSDVFTFLAALSKFGASTSFITKLSKDDYGIQIFDYIVKTGINCSSITTTDKLPTSIVFNTVNPCGQTPRTPGKITGADSLVELKDVNLNIPAHTKVIHFTTSSLAAKPTADTNICLLEAYSNKLISYSTNIDQVFWNHKKDIIEAVNFSLGIANIVFLEEDDLEFVFNRSPITVMKELILSNNNIKIACLRHLSGGCTIMNRSGFAFYPYTYSRDIVDEVEYKNILQAAVMHGILRSDNEPETISNYELERIAKFACNTAEVFANSDGLIRGLPLLQEF